MSDTTTPKAGDKAICQMCTEEIEFVGPHWQHTGLPPGVQPRHPAWPRVPVPEPDISDPLREALAGYAHEAWAGWMKYMLAHGGAEATCTIEGEELTGWFMSPSSYKRWQRQMNTVFSCLPEAEKKSDYEEADKMLAIVRQQ